MHEGDLFPTHSTLPCGPSRRSKSLKVNSHGGTIEKPFKVRPVPSNSVDSNDSFLEWGCLGSRMTITDYDDDDDDV